MDLESLKEKTNLYDLASRDTKLTKVSGANGGEWAGPCPKCGGRDRFHLQGRGLWLCRQCSPKWGDVIGYMQWLHGLDFRAAVEALGGTLEANRSGDFAKNGPKYAKFADQELPGAEWQAKGAAFVEWAQKQLAANREAMNYLLYRGLLPETIKAARLGYNPRDLTRPGAPWGLSEPLTIARGLVIPCYTAAGALAYIKIRQPEGIDPKYRMIKGGHKALYGGDRVQGRPDLILCEGEFDSLLAWQAAAGVADVVTLASASANPAADDIPLLAGARRIWAAYDTDKAGKEGAAKLAALSGRIQRLAWPDNAPATAKDITDLWRAGILLAPWLMQQLGPREPAARLKWTISHLDRLDPDCRDEKNEAAPALAAWIALLRELEALPESERIKPLS